MHDCKAEGRSRPAGNFQNRPFTCKACGAPVSLSGAGSRHRNHCPKCLCSVHLDNLPGDRAADCGGIMDPISVWARPDGEWALIHRCRRCGVLHANRVAADDNPALLLAVAARPLASPPFPLERMEEMLMAELNKEMSVPDGGGPGYQTF